MSAWDKQLKMVQFFKTLKRSGKSIYALSGSTALLGGWDCLLPFLLDDNTDAVTQWFIFQQTEQGK